MSWYSDGISAGFRPGRWQDRLRGICRAAKPRVRESSCANASPVSLHEFKMLQALMDFPGKVFSREQLLDICCQDGIDVVERVIDVHIGKLRQKIELDPSRPRHILTVRGYGDRFNDESEPAGDS
jgi:DNA-binding response OmpR family regulator